jgi:hypothetical protein
MEPEVAISFSQGLPVEEGGGGHKSMDKAFDPKFVLPARCEGIMMEPRLRG